MVEIKIDVTQIPEFRRRELVKFALELCEDAASRPGVQEDYQRWLAERYPERAKEERSTT